EYRKKAEQEGVMSATRFLGYRPDVKELIAISDVCVLSTHYEGQSNALLEYMALKKPIVATNIEENREIITNGKEGILVPEERPDLLAQAITLLLEDKKLAKRLGSAAFERVKKDHNIEKTALKTQELYDSICQRRK
ncbi:glycosyltransferase, partial [Candidatus Woesearchaeota archaeon]